MNFQETCKFLFEKLASYQIVGGKAFNKSLDKTVQLAELFNNPQQKFKSIHIAGTNGKGSSSTLLASIFQEAGFKVGLYTSPHLKSFTERIKINGKEISEQYVIDFVEKTTSFIKIEQPSFFEITTLMAFDYFANENVDIAIIETGLGGRLDSTNILLPEMSLITNIGLDHQNILGNTIQEIAKEKAGIIKENIPIVISEYQELTKTIFEEEAKLKNAPIYFAQDNFKIQDSELKDNLRFIKINNLEYKLDLLGEYQLKNIQGVLQVIDLLKDRFKISLNHIKKGLKNSKKNTLLKGRWQLLNLNPKIICDTGHNEDGIKSILSQLNKENYNELFFVLGMVSDKDYKKILKLFPKNARYVFCKPNIDRALNPKIILEYANEIGLIGEIIENVNEAIEYTKNKCQTNDIIFVGGSTFVVSEIENL